METLDDETLQELADDFEELASLAASAHDVCRTTQKLLNTNEAVYEPATFTYLATQVDDLFRVYMQLLEELDSERAAREAWTGDDIPRLIQLKKQYADLLRTMQSTLASVRVAGNWQSPSIGHTQMPQVGTRAGHVHANTDDYMRDYNPDEEAYARRFAQEYIDHPLRLPPQVHFTSSCMAALTTALAHIRREMKADSVVLMGQASYFQNKIVAEHMFPDSIRYVDESDTDGIVELARTLQPAAILLDTLCGTDSLAMPDLPLLIPKLSSVLSRKTTLVLDNTSLATFCQPLKLLPLNPLGMQLIVVASLSKYYEFGFDRVNGGVLWTPLGSAITLGQSRMHLGTIIPDASLYALPIPNRRIFDRRLIRIGRNARLLAERLEEAAKKRGGTVSHIVYPGLKNHISNGVAEASSFQGGSLVVEFTKGRTTTAQCESFAQRVLSEARRKGVDLIAGTGFGFTTTRVYYTTKYASTTMRPFVRFSTGTETRIEIEALANVIASVISSL